MDSMQPYDVWKRRQQSAAAASYIQSSDEDPDEVADSLNFARQYSERTGNPLPTLSMVREYRPTFQRIMDETRDKALLSTARKTATWYGENPMAVLLAKDDVYNLCSFEEMAQRFGQVPKAFGDVTLPKQTPIGPAANPETPPSVILAGPSAPQQAPAPAPIAPDTQPPDATHENAGSISQSVSSPVDPAGSNTPSSDPLEAQPTAQPAVQPASPNAPATGNAPAAVKDTRSDETKARDALIEEIANAANLTDEQAAALLQKIISQEALDPYNAKFYLDAVRTNGATPDDVFTYLAHSSSSTVKRTEEFGQNLVEVPKGAASAAVTATGRIVEGTGQLMRIPKSEEELARIDRISKAANLSDKDYALLDMELDKLSWFQAATAKRVLRDVRAGRLTADQAKARFDSTWDNLSQYLQTQGAHVGDFGETIFRPAAGYENSWGRMTGEILGANLPNIVATVTVGRFAGTGVEILRAAGDGTAAARKANLSEGQQSLAAWAYAPTALVDKIPFDRVSSPVLKRVYLNSFLQKWIAVGFKEGGAQASQLVAQNAAKHYFIDPKQEFSEKVAATFVAGGVAGIGKEIIQDAATVALRMLTRGRGSLHISASKPEAAIQDRQQFEELATTAESSKFRQRDPEGHREHTAEVLKDTKVEHFYTSPESVDNYGKATGADPFGLNDTPAMQVAKDTGSDLKIPTTDYLAKSTPSKADADFRDSMRFGADALNHSEALASHIGVPAPGLNPGVKQNGPYIATGYVGNQKVDDHAVSHSPNADPTAKKMGRVGNSGNTKRNPSGLSITSTRPQP